MKAISKTFIFLSFVFSLTVSAGSIREELHSGLTDIGSGSGTKQMCSCLFVMKQSESFCRKFSREVLIIDILDQHYVNKDKKSVTSTIGFFFNKRTAKYMGKKHGCTLI